jgi:hypothetical protein
MLTLTEKPAVLDHFGILAFSTILELGEVGTVSITLQFPKEMEDTHFGLFAKLQDGLGEKAACRYETADGSWEFSGLIDRIVYEADEKCITLTVADALSGLSRTQRPRVFAEQTFEKVVSAILPDGQEYMLSSGFGNQKIRLAIQYKESDLEFLRRLANQHGGQVWCMGSTVYIGAPDESGGLSLELGHDVTGFTLYSALGPEQVAIQPLPYTTESRDQKILELGGGPGDIQAKVSGRRKKYQEESKLHIVLEDTSYNQHENIARGFLKAQAAGRLSMVGALKVPISAGEVVSIVDSDGHEESLLIRSLSGRWQLGLPPSFHFEATPTEAVVSEFEWGGARLMCSTAIVEQASEKMNRVRVSFPWDDEHCITPWLRMTTPYWGKEHLHYIPPAKGDTVLVAWGQPDLDALVLGSLTGGEVAQDESARFALQTADGKTISFGKEDIRIVNKGKTGESTVEILPDKVIIDSDKIELKSKKLDVSADLADVKTQKMDVK